jgi:undecaprenyl pyrophosphate phosphatase UppP
VHFLTRFFKTRNLKPFGIYCIVFGAALIAALFAAVTAVGTVHFLTRFFKTRNLKPFGIYCIVFGAAMVIYNA